MRFTRRDTQEEVSDHCSDDLQADGGFGGADELWI